MASDSSKTDNSVSKLTTMFNSISHSRKQKQATMGKRNTNSVKRISNMFERLSKSQNQETSNSKNFDSRSLRQGLSTVSEDESNFLRAAHLMFTIVPNAIRVFFDSNHPPAKLRKQLASRKQELLRANRSFKDHEDILFPKRGDVYSGNFDISLLMTLLRNFTNVKEPATGWNQFPAASDVTEGADLVRLRLRRNQLAHSSSGKMNKEEFTACWTDIKEPVSRLAGGKFDSDVQMLQMSTLDRKYRNVVEELLRQNKTQFMQEEKITKHELSLQLQARAIENLEKATMPGNVKGLNKEILDKWESEDSVFYETRSYEKAFEMANRLDLLFIIGGPGSGKTALARHLVLQLSKKYGFDIVPVDCSNEIVQFGDLQTHKIFFLDNVFGIFHFDRSKFNEIESHKERIKLLMNTGSKLIMTCRKLVFKEGLRFKPFVADDNNVLDIEDEHYQLVRTEKIGILQKHCRIAKVDENVYSHMSLLSASHMFPLLCKLFSGNTKYQELGVKFFSHPFDCVALEIDNLKVHAPENYVSLVICAMNNNKIPSNVPNKGYQFKSSLKTDVCKRCTVSEISDWSIQSALLKMEGTYTTNTGTHFTIIHDCVFEVVVCHYGKMFPDQILKYLTSCFIAKKVTIQNLNVSRIDEINIKLKETEYRLLANRLYRDIRAFKLSDVFMNEALLNTSFCNVFIRVLQVKPYKKLETLFLSDQGEISKIIKKGKTRLFHDTTYKRLRPDWKKQELLYDRRDYFEAVSMQYKSIYNIRVISWVIFYGHVRILQHILERVKAENEPLDVVFGRNLAEQTRLLVLACYHGDYELVKTILECVNAICKNRTPQYSEDETFLLKNDFHRCYTPLTVASKSGHLSVVELLLRSGVEIDKRDGRENTALVRAASAGHDLVVEKLLEFGASCNEFGRLQQSPVYVSAAFGHTSIVKTLVNNGADCNACTKKGKSPLHVAAKEGHVSVIDILITNKANVNQCDKNNKTPLYVAARAGHINVVENLIKNGADCKLCATMNRSPLYIASKSGNVSVVEALLKHPSIANEFRRMTLERVTPLEIALWRNKRDVVEVLMKGENQCESRRGNFHLFEILLKFRNSTLSLDSRDNVIVKEQSPFRFYEDGDLWDSIANENSVCFEHILSIGFPADMSITLNENDLFDENTFTNDDENSFQNTHNKDRQPLNKRVPYGDENFNQESNKNKNKSTPRQIDDENKKIKDEDDEDDNDENNNDDDVDDYEKDVYYDVEEEEENDNDGDDNEKEIDYDDYEEVEDDEDEHYDIDENETDDDEIQPLINVLPDQDIVAKCEKVKLLVKHGANITQRDDEFISLMEKIRKRSCQLHDVTIATEDQMEHTKILQEIKHHVRRFSFS